MHFNYKINSDERGLALITVLLIVAILTTLVTDFIYRSYITTSRAANFRDSARASLLARDGVTLARAGLEELIKKDPNLVMDAAGMVFSKTVAEGLQIDVRAIDERSRVSARIAYPLTGVIEPKAHGSYGRLLKAVRISDESLVDALADWIDNDSAPRARGAEEHYYKALSTPYKPRNNYLESVDELRLIKGYNNDVLKTIGQYVTPYNPDGLVNINTAQKPVLMSLTDEMTEALADGIITFRSGTPFKDRSDVMKVHGFERVGFSLQDRITTTSNAYRVFSRASAGEVVREVEAVIQLGGGVLYWREM